MEDTPPAWIRRPSYAVAASYLLTVLVGAALGNPATFAREKAVPLTTGFTEELTAGLEKQARTTLTGAGTEARLQLDQLSASAGKTYRDSKALLVSSLDTTHRRIKELAGTILPAGEPEERDANGDPPPSKGDTDE